jgi:hypothetical protein
LPTLAFSAEKPFIANRVDRAVDTTLTSISPAEALLVTSAVTAAESLDETDFAL